MARRSFETSLEKLELITNELEAGSLSLEKSMKKFAEGMELITFCEKQLEEAQKKIALIVEQKEDSEE